MRVDRGPILKFYCRAKAQEKQHFGKSHFYCRRFFPGNTVTILLDNYPPSTLQGVGLGGRKNPRIIVGENYCHFGASYLRVAGPVALVVKMRQKCVEHLWGLSGPISRNIAILSLRYRAILFWGGWHSPNMVRYPPLGT